MVNIMLTNVMTRYFTSVLVVCCTSINVLMALYGINPLEIVNGRGNKCKYSTFLYY